MSNEINVEKAWENQLTRRIDELNKENQDLWLMLRDLSRITRTVLSANEKISYGDWMELITNCNAIYGRAVGHLEDKQ